jgi:two-component system, NarL family, sensor histidine kinase UhpB
MPIVAPVARARLTRCRAAVSALVALCLWFALMPRALAQDDVVTLEQAAVVVSDASAYPVTPLAHDVSLPDDWSLSQPRAAGPVWYRLRVDGSRLAQEDSTAIYIERACARSSVWLNGQRLHSDDGVSAAGLYRCDRPLLIDLPASLLRPGENLLDIKLAGRPLPRVALRERGAGLSPVHIGPYATLARWRDLHEFSHVVLPSTIGMVLLLTGLFTLVVGWRPIRKAYLLQFGLLASASGLFAMGSWLRFSTLPVGLIEWSMTVLVPVIAAFAVLFLMRYAGLLIRGFDAALLAQCLVFPLSLALAGENQLFLVAQTWTVLLAFEVLAAAVAALRLAWKMQRREFWIMLVLLGVVAVSWLSYLGTQQGWLMPSPWLRLIMPLAFVTLGLRLLYVEVSGVRSVEFEMRTMVEKRIADASAEAERNFAALAELRVEQVTERERKRIAADLHDDLGAKLLTIVHTSESDRISTLAREALEEMRLSVRGLTGKPVRLVDALGDWRAEVVSRLGQANIGAEWQMPSEEPPQTLPARAYVQTTRILREAVSNIIKHSGAARCVINGRVQDGDFVLTIQDNGHGIPMALDGNLDRGHGMASMKHRAKQLQGQCLVESGPGFGTVIRLTVPL